MEYGLADSLSDFMPAHYDECAQRNMFAHRPLCDAHDAIFFLMDSQGADHASISFAEGLALAEEWYNPQYREALGLALSLDDTFEHTISDEVKYEWARLAATHPFGAAYILCHYPDTLPAEIDVEARKNINPVTLEAIENSQRVQKYKRAF